MTRYPDNPTAISFDFLKQLDRDPPGTWIGSAKLDGWRKICDNTSGAWHYGAKHTKGDAARPLPEDLRLEFGSLPWPAGICLDAEWLGPRVASVVKEHSLHVFDILTAGGEWLGNVPYWKRQEMLKDLRVDMVESFWEIPLRQQLPEGRHVHLVQTFSNPGLCERYEEQKLNPLSEGLVVRHKSSLLTGSFAGCAKGDRFYKIKYR